MPLDVDACVDDDGVVLAEDDADAVGEGVVLVHGVFCVLVDRGLSGRQERVAEGGESDAGKGFEGVLADEGYEEYLFICL